MAGTTFPRFLNLPAEIRCRIWEFTYPHERFIQIISTGFDYENKSWYLDHEGTHWTISGTSPVALRVCHESREFAKKRYKTIYECFLKKEIQESKDNQPKTPRIGITGFLSIRIDLEYDTILLGPAHVKYLRQWFDFTKIKHLALMSYEEYLGTDPVWMERLRRKPVWTGPPESNCWTNVWPNLKSLNFILGRTSRVPDSNNSSWQPDFKLVDVDSNFSDLVAATKQMEPKEGNGAPPNNTLFNFCSIATRLKQNFQAAKREIEKVKKWEKLDFRVTVAVFQTEMVLRDFDSCPTHDIRHKLSDRFVMYMRSCLNRTQIPEYTPFTQCSRSGLYYWIERMAVCYPDGEPKSRYDGIQRLFTE